ncbi:MAG TPA: hypothetical protein VFG35_07570 [Actinoplanes sp.]|nr:hypothetical protein [Actinoplanes sp.]
MTSATPGQTTTFTAQFYQYAGGPAADVTNLTVSIVTSSATVVVAPTAVGISHLATGLYSYAWAVPAGQTAGDYVIVWTSDETQASEQFTVGNAPSSSTGASPCSPWDPIWCCDLTAQSPVTTGFALQAASDILYQLSGQRFGLCTLTVRPCRRSCGGDDGPFNGGQWWEWGSYGAGAGLWPVPWLYNGAWMNLTCGGCFGTCSCTPLSEAILPSPVHSVQEVKVDGVVLTPGTDYHVDDFRKLVRLGGQSWPICQDFTKADTQTDTWSVTFTVGEEVPAAGKLAVGELACEIVKACSGQACAIPKNATQVTRQGITIDFPTFTDLLERGLLGLRWTDTFIATYNPNRLRAVPMVYDVDGTDFRRVGTS